MKRAFLLCMMLAAAPLPAFAQGTVSAPLAGKLLITGSSSMAPRVEELGKRFRTRHPGVVITVEAGGSGRGVGDALELVTAITIALLGMLVTGYAYSVRLLRPIRALRAQAPGMVREQLGETIDASTSSNEVAALVESFQFLVPKCGAAQLDTLSRSPFGITVGP